MGRLTNAAAGRIYLDSNIFIYHLDGHPTYKGCLERLAEMMAAREIEMFTSELSIAETLVPAYRTNDRERIAICLRLFNDGDFVTLVPTTQAVYVRCAMYRASFGLKTSDAVHVASAVEAKCRFFLSNDRTIRVPGAIRMVALDEI